MFFAHLCTSDPTSCLSMSKGYCGNKRDGMERETCENVLYLVKLIVVGVKRPVRCEARLHITT